MFQFCKMRGYFLIFIIVFGSGKDHLFFVIGGSGSSAVVIFCCFSAEETRPFLFNSS